MATPTRESVAANYVLDAGASRFQIKVFATGFLSAFGHSPTIEARGVSGEVRFDPRDPGSGWVRLSLDTASLVVTNDIRDKDRKEIEETMRRDVLEPQRYPAIVFESSGVSVTTVAESSFRIEVAGRLSMHGTTRALTVPLFLIVTAGGLRAHGEFTVRMSEYQIPPVTAVGGGLKLKDELKCSFDLAARQTPGGPAAS